MPKLGMNHDAPSAPDLFGLVEYFVTDVLTEIAGSNVRMICGVRRCGEIHWLYTAVMPAELLLGNAKGCSNAAEEASIIQKLLGRQHSH